MSNVRYVPLDDVKCKCHHAIVKIQIRTIFTYISEIALYDYVSRIMRKPVLAYVKTNELHGNCAADQRLCFPHIDSTIPLPPKSKISSLYPSSVAAQPGMCRTWSEIPVFLRCGSCMNIERHLHSI